MNDEVDEAGEVDETGPPDEAGPPDDAAGALLRRAGAVEAPPPPHVWEAVLAALRGERGATTGDDLQTRRAHRAARGSGARGTGSGRDGRGRDGTGPGRAGPDRAGSRWSLLLAAAAAGALVTWVGFELGGEPDGGVVLASGQLAPLAQAAPAGDAEVVEVDGHHRLRVTLEDAPDAGDGYLEVWLLRPDVSGMVTLGVLEGDSGEFLLPPGLDLGEYPVVDISLERVDGDPSHGGDSLVRGEVG